MASILVLGGSGYIGAPFITALRKKYPDLRLTAYVRSTASDDEFAALNVNVVHGNFDELERLANLAANNDIVVNAADSLNIDLTSVLVRGLKLSDKGKKSIIHLSGTGNFSDGGSSGNFNAASKVWNDGNLDDIRQIDGKMLNGACDKIILDAGAAGYIVDYIVAPGGVFGQARTEIAKGALGFFVRTMFNSCSLLGYCPFIGDGTAVFHLSEVNDVVSLLMLVFERALRGEDAERPYQRYYVAGGVDKSWKYIATSFAKVLYEKGKIEEAAARQVVFDQAGILAGLIGANILVKYDNAKRLGYRPQGPDISEVLSNAIWGQDMPS